MTDRRARLITGPPEAVEEILGILDDTTINVLLPERVPWRRQLLAIALVDLLARLFPRIHVLGGGQQPADPLLPPGERLLHERLAESRTHGTEPRVPGATATVTIVVGATDVPLGDGAREVIYCDGDGWQSYLGPRPSELAGEGDHCVPVGPLTAACRAAARAFAVATAGRGPVVSQLTPTYWSALTFEADSQPLAAVELPPPDRLAAVLAGAGSIGGAAAYAFARVPNLAGELSVVDPQSYDENNPDRALLTTNAVVAAEAEKASHVAQVLSHLPLDVDPYRGTIEEWVASRPLGPLPLVLCAFDSVESRRELQDALPMQVANAACGGDHIAVSGHVTDNGPCVYCLHIADVLDSERITFKLILASTGLPARMVQAWLEQGVRLEKQHLREIERNREMPEGALDPYVGLTVDELHRVALAYGEFTVELTNGIAAVAAPWVTGLAGFITAGEALKAATPAYEAYRLGPWSPGRTRYEELLYGSAADAIVGPVARWEGSECLCRSTRRLRLLAELYPQT
jgi:hypothetical protein